MSEKSSLMQRLCLIGAALLWLLQPLPALACSYAFAPEPVGGPSAMFIAKRMVAEAAFIDLAVPERSERLSTPDGRQLITNAVTFRVKERLKGNSEERFTLFAAGLQPATAKPEPEPLLHWVDEATGAVTPHATPWEAPASEEYLTTSCDPGYIRPIVGRTYLVFRAADGSLLGPISFQPPGRPARGFPFIDAGTGAEGEWVRAVRFQIAPLAQSQRTGPPQRLPVPYEADHKRGSVAFRQPLTESEARMLFETAGARPYAVYTYALDSSGEHRVPDSQASLDVVAAARPKNQERTGAPPRGIVDRARILIESHTAEQLARDPGMLGRARALLRALEANEERARGLPAGAPFIVGAEFLGGPEARERLARSSLVVEVRPGYRVRGRPAVPRPRYRIPEGRTPSAVDALSPAEVHARLRAIAATSTR